MSLVYEPDPVTHAAGTDIAPPPDKREKRAITFVRPDPTRFVLLTARTGVGTGVVVGTQNFKPSGTEWATDRDLRDAGYVPEREALKIVELLADALATAREGPISEPVALELMRQAAKLLPR